MKKVNIIKKAVSVLLTLLLAISLVSSLALPSFALSSGNFNYALIDNGANVRITGYTGTGGAVTIPDTIAGKPVTEIGYNAFENKTSITSVIIPDSVININNYAFLQCSGITSITIGNSVKNIRIYAFYGCRKLTSIIIPNSVTNISNYAFSSCSSLTSITIPNSVTIIGDYAFSGCLKLTTVDISSSVSSIGKQAFYFSPVLTSINVDSNNLFYSSTDGVLFNKDKTIIIQYPAGKTTTCYIIPNSVTILGEFAFYQCISLKSITIPNSVTSIGNNTFSSCGITSITIPNSVTSIGDGAFYLCSGITTITIPNSVTSISSDTFSSCANLIKIAIPNSVTSIAPNAFFGSTKVVIYGADNSYAKTFAASKNIQFVVIPSVSITINSYVNTPTNQNVTVTAAANEGTLNETSHTFTENGSFDFVATDDVGNVITITVTINNIDKVAPMITLADYNTTPTNKNITVTASTNEGSLNAPTHTFAENGIFEFVATDDAGNVTNKTVTIANIYKLGDTNGDNIIDILDLAAVKNHLLGINFLNGINKIAGDIYDNGNISISDLIAIKKHLLGIQTIS